MVPADPPASSYRKLARAKKHIADLDGEVMAFLDGNPYAEVCEPDPQRPDYSVRKVRLVRSLPLSLAEIVGDAANNLRSALDHAGYEIAVASGRVHPLHAYFPFARSAAEFDKTARGRCKDVPDEIFALFRGLEPYKGGNNHLWALNRIAVGDKHKMITAMASVALRTTFRIGGTGYFSAPENPVWDRTKNEIVIATIGPGSTFDYQFDFFAFVAFDDIEIVGGQPAVFVLNYLAGEVERILLAIEAEGRRIGLIV